MNKEIISIQTGATIDCILMHEQLGDHASLLSDSLITPSQVRRNHEFEAFLKDCVDRANRLIDEEFPPLLEAIGEFQLSDILDELCESITVYAEAWYLGRELLGDFLEDPDSLELF